MAGVDYAIAKGLLDPDRLALGGLSGGGNLTCWAVGQTDRFKAAIPENPVTNWVSFMASATWAPGFPWSSWAANPTKCQRSTSAAPPSPTPTAAKHLPYWCRARATIGCRRNSQSSSMRSCRSAAARWRCCVYLAAPTAARSPQQAHPAPGAERGPAGLGAALRAGVKVVIR